MISLVSVPVSKSGDSSNKKEYIIVRSFQTRNELVQVREATKQIMMMRWGDVSWWCDVVNMISLGFSLIRGALRCWVWQVVSSQVMPVVVWQDISALSSPETGCHSTATNFLTRRSHRGSFPPAPPPSTLDHLPPSIKTVKNSSQGPGPLGFTAAGVTGFSFRCSDQVFLQVQLFLLNNH